MSPTSVSTPPPHTTFGRRLRTELNRQDMSVRALARTMRPDRPEDARRNLARWLSADADKAVSPSSSNRRDVAEALGLDENHFDEDDEEADPWSLMLRAVQLLRQRDQAVPGVGT